MNDKYVQVPKRHSSFLQEDGNENDSFIVSELSSQLRVLMKFGSSLGVWSLGED